MLLKTIHFWARQYSPELLTYAVLLLKLPVTKNVTERRRKIFVFYFSSSFYIIYYKIFPKNNIFSIQNMVIFPWMMIFEKIQILFSFFHISRQLHSKYLSSFPTTKREFTSSWQKDFTIYFLIKCLNFSAKKHSIYWYFFIEGFFIYSLIQ